jgi:molecular chaperone IbpB/HSP20 family protein
MKNKDFLDLRELMDEIFEAATDFKNAFTDEMGSWKPDFNWGEHRDYYPAYSYPPTNVYMTADKSLVFQFALAGFREEDISLEFRGDYLFFSAKSPDGYEEDESIRYFKRRLKFKDIKEQKYFVPEDKFDRESVKAVLKNAILSVTIPAKDEVKGPEGVKVEIVSEEEKPNTPPKSTKKDKE